MPQLLCVATVSETLIGFLLPFARHFSAQGWRVDAMAKGAASSPDCRAAYHRVCEASWSRNPLDPRNLVVAAQSIRQQVTNERYDIVHVHTPVAAFVTRYALKDLPKRGRPVVIYTAHGFHFHSSGNPLKNAAYRTLEKVAGPWTDYLIVINREDERAAIEHRLLPADRIRFMPGIGVDLDHYGGVAPGASLVSPIHEELQLSSDVEFLLCVAEFIPRKRHADILHAFASVKRPTAHLLLAGAGPQMERMRNLAFELGIASRVHFLGVRRHSHFDPLFTGPGAGILTGRATKKCDGVPVCGCAGHRHRHSWHARDLIADDSGLLVKLGDIAGLADAMTWILEHPEQAYAMGQSGRIKMADYDLEHVIELHENLYHEALAHNTRVLSPPLAVSQ